MSHFSDQVQDLIDLLNAYSEKVYEIQEAQYRNISGHPHNHDGLALDEAKMNALNRNDAFRFIHQSKENLWVLASQLEKIRDEYKNKGDATGSPELS